MHASAEPEIVDSTDVVEARLRLGRAIRELGHAVVAQDAPADELAAAAAALESITARLHDGDHRARHKARFGFARIPAPPDGEVIRTTHIDRPFSGRASPWGADYDVTRDGTRAQATMTLGPAHEGPPARCHGGIIAGIFDDVTGYVLQLEQIVAFTGQLNVRYERAAPLGERITFRAWLDRREGRKLYIDADATCHGQRIALCNSIYIVVDSIL